MDALLDFLLDLTGGSPALLLGIFVFFAVATITFVVMAFLRVRGSIKRRATEVLTDGRSRRDTNKNSLRFASLKAAQKLLDYTVRYYAAADGGNMKLLRMKLVQAGFLNPSSAGFFFVARTGLAVGLALAAFIGLPFFDPDMSTSSRWLVIGMSGLAGYFGPSFYLGRRISSRQNEHRAGFPDFMDLLVVCAEAGLSMEAALDRVGRELADSYRSLSANIHMATLEIRAGRTLSDALEHLGDRLGLEEARAFATLLQQSAELGSSLTDALRIYSDEMRHKRLSRAEEKAYSLPSKLSVPLILCIFPVLVIVTLLPAYIRVKYGVY
ncbi:MAG TPA: type II secretion system F family protein [Xanthobacteraceae bacterium]|nr:type II secretion system F family protein [Xanthobacteraceae bacterium]